MGSSKVVCLVFALQLASCLTTIKATDDFFGHALNVRANYQPHNESWAYFKSLLGRQYNNVSEEAYRFGVFLENVKMVEAHNANFLKGNVTYWMGINQFTDMTFEEFTDRYLLSEAGPDVNATGDPLRCSLFVNPNDNYPDNKFWSPWTLVKDQGNCKSCWAFSVTGAIEYQYKKMHPYVSLSEQQLIDCSRPYGNDGCEGGWPFKAFKYIKAAPGIESTTSYPYTAKDGTCKFNQALTVTTVSGCQSVAVGNEDDLKAAVATQGAVSVVILISNAFKNYCGGVLTDDTCRVSINSPYHAVVVVGYGVSGSQDYWVVQNSWGPKWGENGLIRMRRNYYNMCGIASYAMYPILSDTGLTSEQSTCRASSNMAFSLSIVTGIVLLVQALVS